MDISLLDLPKEIICKILSYLPLRCCLYNLRRVCRSLNVICNSCLPWTDVELGKGTMLYDENKFYDIVKHSRHFKTFRFCNTLEFNMPINGLSFILDSHFRSPMLQELDMSYTNISSLYFLKWSPLLKILILRKCLALSSIDDLILSLKTHQLKVLDISYCQSEGTLESIALNLPYLEELYAYNYQISVESLMTVLKACAFNKLQLLGAHCEYGHRPWEYLCSIVDSYPDFVLIMKEFEDNFSTVSYPSGSDEDLF